MVRSKGSDYTELRAPRALAWTAIIVPDRLPAGNRSGRCARPRWPPR